MTTIAPKKFAEVNVSEREHLQKLLRDNPSALEQAIGEKLLIISEEDSNWKGSDRRVDLLALDKGNLAEDSSAITVNLVVIELKVAEGGGHMELQSIRYAAMLSNMNFKAVVETYEKFSKKPSDVAQRELLKFLENSESGQPLESEQVLISKNPRIILISPSFSKEITTTVLWLNERGLDIQCLEATPYKIEAEIYLDLEQVIPLPEAKEYIVQRREKVQKETATSLQRRQSNKPKKMTWSDNEKKPIEVTSWRALMVSVVHRALSEGLSPQQLPMPTASESDAAKLEIFHSPEHFPDQKLFVDLLGSSDTIQGWIKTILKELNVGGKKLSLQVDTASGIPIKFGL